MSSSQISEKQNKMPNINLFSGETFRKKFSNYLAIGLAGLTIYSAFIGGSRIARNYSMNKNKAIVQKAINERDFDFADSLLKAYNERKSMRLEDGIKFGMIIGKEREKNYFRLKNKNIEEAYLDSIRNEYVGHLSLARIITSRLNSLENEVREVKTLGYRNYEPRAAANGGNGGNNGGNTGGTIANLKNMNYMLKKTNKYLDNYIAREEGAEQSDEIFENYSFSGVEKTIAELDRETKLVIIDEKINELECKKKFYLNSIRNVFSLKTIKKLKEKIPSVDAEIKELRRKKFEVMSGISRDTIGLSGANSSNEEIRRLDKSGDAYRNSIYEGKQERFQNVRNLSDEILSQFQILREKMSK